jgi:hypothetical protein
MPLASLGGETSWFARVTSFLQQWKFDFINPYYRVILWFPILDRRDVNIGSMDDMYKAYKKFAWIEPNEPLSPQVIY